MPGFRERACTRRYRESEAQTCGEPRVLRWSSFRDDFRQVLDVAGLLVLDALVNRAVQRRRSSSSRSSPSVAITSSSGMSSITWPSGKSDGLEFAARMTVSLAHDTQGGGDSLFDSVPNGRILLGRPVLAVTADLNGETASIKPMEVMRKASRSESTRTAGTTATCVLRVVRLSSESRSSCLPRAFAARRRILRRRQHSLQRRQGTSPSTP